MSYILIQHYLSDEDKEIITKCLQNDFSVSMMIGTEEDTIVPEITEKQVKEYCEKRALVVISSDLYHTLTAPYPTLYGYDVKHLAFIAEIMQKEGITPEKAIEYFTGIERIANMLITEQKELIEKSLLGSLRKEV